MTYGSVFVDEEEDEEVSYLTESAERTPCERCCDVSFPAGFCSEFKKMVVLTWPICVTQICQMIIGPISLIFCGHLGDAVKLDGAAMAISMINATCICVAQGMGTACDTFYSQSFGSKNKKKVGMYLQKAVCIFTLALLVCITLNINMELLLRLLGQDAEVARLAGQYTLIFIPGAICFFLYVILSKYIQTQNIVIPNVIIGLIANAVNATLHYIFLYRLDWGTNGSALAQSVSYVLMCVLTLSYIIVFKKYRETWGGWSSSCLQNWGQFGRLAVPGMLMVCLEWWGFEIGVFLTGLLGRIELGAQSVVLQIDSIWFQIPLGIQIATGIRIGQYLGSGNKMGAITAARLGIVVVLILSIVMSSVFMIFRYQLPYFFTNVVDIAELTGDLLPIVSLYMIFDGLATTCKGVLCGTGRQTIGAIILFVSYYLVALPSGVPVMFLTSLRSAAYWWALAFNLLAQSIVLFTLVATTNWDKQIEKAQERAGMMGEVMQDETADENAHLIPETVLTRPGSKKQRRVSRNRLLSKSLTLTTSEIKALLQVYEEEPLGKVLVKRVLTLFLMLLILGAGVAVRLLVHLPDHVTHDVTDDATKINVIEVSNLTMTDAIYRISDAPGVVNTTEGPYHTIPDRTYHINEMGDHGISEFMNRNLSDEVITTPFSEDIFPSELQNTTKLPSIAPKTSSSNVVVMEQSRRIITTVPTEKMIDTTEAFSKSRMNKDIVSSLPENISDMGPTVPTPLRPETPKVTSQPNNLTNITLLELPSSPIQQSTILIPNFKENPNIVAQSASPPTPFIDKTPSTPFTPEDLNRSTRNDFSPKAEKPDTQTTGGLLENPSTHFQEEVPPSHYQKKTPTSSPLPESDSQHVIDKNLTQDSQTDLMEESFSAPSQKDNMTLVADIVSTDSLGYTGFHHYKSQQTLR